MEEKVWAQFKLQEVHGISANQSEAARFLLQIRQQKSKNDEHLESPRPTQQTNEANAKPSGNVLAKVSMNSLGSPLGLGVKFGIWMSLER